MGKINTVWAYIRRHKYLITLVIGILMVGVVDENSFRKYITNQFRINELNAQIEECTEQYERDSVLLRALLDNPKGAEKIARERYYMKRPNEDIYIISEQ